MHNPYLSADYLPFLETHFIVDSFHNHSHSHSLPIMPTSSSKIITHGLSQNQTQKLTKITKLLSAESFSDNVQNTSMLLLTMAEEYESKIRYLESQLALSNKEARKWQRRCTEMQQEEDEQKSTCSVIIEHRLITERIEIEEIVLEFKHRSCDEEDNANARIPKKIEINGGVSDEQKEDEMAKEAVDSNLNVQVLTKMMNVINIKDGDENQSEIAYSELAKGMKKLEQYLGQMDSSDQDDDTAYRSVSLTNSSFSSSGSSTFENKDFFVIETAEKQEVVAPNAEIRVTSSFFEQLRYIMGDELAEEIWRNSATLETSQGDKKMYEGDEVVIDGSALVTALEILISERDSFLNELAALYDVEKSSV